MRIAEVLLSLDMGGQEVMALHLTKELLRRGHEVIVASRICDELVFGDARLRAGLETTRRRIERHRDRLDGNALRRRLDPRRVRDQRIAQAL